MDGHLALAQRKRLYEIFSSNFVESENSLLGFLSLVRQGTIGFAVILSKILPLGALRRHAANRFHDRRYF